MKKMTHFVIIISSLSCALTLVILNSKTLTISKLLIDSKQQIVVIVYTLLFMSVLYTGVWIYLQSKRNSKDF